MSNNPKNRAISITLAELGLSENEANLYEILLETPEATIPVLVHKTGFSRTLMYYLLEKLASYELIETKKIGKKTVYDTTPPENLEDFLTSQEKELERQKKNLQEIMPDLRSSYLLSHNRPNVRFFEGETGIREVWWDSLKSGGEICTYGDLEFLAKNFHALNAEYLAERTKRKINKRAITNDSIFNRAWLAKYDVNFTNTILTKKFPVDFSSVVVQIYDGKISYTTLSGDVKIGVIISDPQIYRMQKSLFEFTWKILATI